MVVRSDEAPSRGPLRGSLRWLCCSPSVPVALALGVYFAWEPVASRQLWNGEDYALSLAATLRTTGLGLCLIVGLGSVVRAALHARAGRRREGLASLGRLALVALPCAWNALGARPIEDFLNRRRFDQVRSDFAEAAARRPEHFELPWGTVLDQHKHWGQATYRIARDSFNVSGLVHEPSDEFRARVNRCLELGDDWWLYYD
ncbi:MAG: hypothetical protein H6828_01865 [Planctomycetes bacterium]|nr:hypothetical protein [Planctomycetota bacterium]